MTTAELEERHVHAPFTPEQVESLNGYQRSGVMHPFTCGRSDQHPPFDEFEVREEAKLLQATEAGWVCPTCDYKQGWAWIWMADGSWEQMRLF